MPPNVVVLLNIVGRVTHVTMRPQGAKYADFNTVGAGLGYRTNIESVRMPETDPARRSVHGDVDAASDVPEVEDDAP